MPQPALYRILVLDDDEVFLNLANAFLSMAGHQVTALSHSDQALAALKTNSAFDLVLTDLTMPGLEGQALAGTLRAAMPANAPLLGISATQPSAETVALFDAFLLKPLNPQTLQDAVHNAIENRASRGAAAATSPEPQATSKPILDEAILGSLARTIPPPQLHKLYEMGIADVEKRLLRIQEAATTGDMATIRREAHAIKGSCGMVGARELEALASAIEDSTTFDASAMAQMPHACLRLRRMLGAKLQTV